MLRSEDARPFVEGRPAAALARRVAPTYAGHVGAVLPADWLDGYAQPKEGLTP